MDDAQVILDTIQAIEERDVEHLFSLFHEDVQITDAPSLPYGGTVSGRETLREQMERSPEETWLGTWGPLQPTEDDRRMDPRVIASEDGKVTVQYKLRALSPTGERFESEVIALYEVRDEKFAKARMFHYDTAALLAFLQRADARVEAA